MNIKDLFPDLRGTRPAPKPEDRREPSHTKAGPGRKHLQGDGKQRTTAQKKAGAYGRGLRNHFNRLAAARAAQRAMKHLDRRLCR